jgi:cell division protein DivIC
MAAFLTWAAFIAWDQQGRLNVKAAELEQLENELRETVKINEDFQKEIRRLNDPEYILQHIRKQYHYTKPGETLFYTPKSP